MADEIVLGHGVFAIGATDIGLTRGGGAFSVEREIREITADGDYGPVKGRMSLDREVATLTVNALKFDPADLSKLYPALTVDSTTVGTDAITSNVAIADTDYNAAITWTGRTTSGRSVIITLNNAINIEGIDWSLVDKDEVVPEITFTAAYDPATRAAAPWKIEYVDA